MTSKDLITATSLFERVVSILEEARSQVVRSVNTSAVLANWLIGREIVRDLQGGDERAEYGRRLIDDLSAQLTEKYGRGFSAINLRNFRAFYMAYSSRTPIQHTSCVESKPDTIQHIPCVKSKPDQIRHMACDELLPSFNPQLSWSHYRLLMRVADTDAREFYEQETAECGWTHDQLERQIKTAYYDRLLKNNNGLLPVTRERLAGDKVSPIHLLKAPYLLEFLDLPDSPARHEKDLETAIINNLQMFLLELGKGFSFVARQKHIRFDDDDYYIDLVFYNYFLKCFLLIDLKLGKLTHKDVGQMDGYVRLFEDQFKVPGDNPTIGLILCSDKSEAVARYSVLNEGKQIFAAKYLNILPSEEELKRAIAKERQIWELQWSEYTQDREGRR
jgi:predicted nuclease of restriction endonuclease-like (RecB) superfamily